MKSQLLPTSGLLLFPALAPCVPTPRSPNPATSSTNIHTQRNQVTLRLFFRRKGTHSEQYSATLWGSTHSLGIALCSFLLRFPITLTFRRLVLFIHPVRDMFKGTFYRWHHVLDSFKFLWRWINGWMFHHNMAVIISKRSDRSLLWSGKQGGEKENKVIPLSTEGNRLNGNPPDRRRKVVYDDHCL